MTSASLSLLVDEKMKEAMRAKDSQRLLVIRLMKSAIKDREIETRALASDADVLAIFDKMLKQRRDSIQQFDAAGRTELADQERYEIKIIQEFMPAPLSEAEVNVIIAKAIKDSGANGMQDMGRVMAIVKPLLQGRADMGKVSGQIKGQLT